MQHVIEHIVGMTQASTPASPGASLPRQWLREHGLGLAALAFFIAFWVAQCLAGWLAYNGDQQAHHQAQVALGAYLGSGHFWQATAENWESEFLQMFAFVLLTALLVHKGSAESRPLEGDPERDADPVEHRGDRDAPGPVKRGGAWLAVYQNSLALAFLLLFLASFALHATAGAILYNEEQRQHGERAISLLRFLGSSEFWFQSFQNWQSEFLAVASMVWLSVYLRQRGSAESKPVHAPHSQTGD